MSENIERVDQVMAIVQKHLELMINEVWETLATEEKTREMGGSLTNAEYDLTKIIINELSTIDACN
jgi:hypothetical protein